MFVKFLCPDQPVDLAEGEAVELDIRRRAECSGERRGVIVALAFDSIEA